jgi:hypothetical protein
MVIKASLLLVFLISASVTTEAQLLRRHRSQLRSMKQESGFTLYEKGTPLAAVRSLKKHLSDNGGKEINTLVVSRMPLTRDQYFVMAQDADGLNKFLVLRIQGEGIVEISKAENDISCGILEPAFFVGKDRTLIVISISAFDGGYCGNYPFEFKNGKLKSLGDIAVYDGVHGRGGHQGHSPIEKATARFEGETYYVTMRGKGSLYDEKERRIAAPNSPATYFYDGQTFRPLSSKGRKRR